jgi:hypothetical protein
MAHRSFAFASLRTGLACMVGIAATMFVVSSQPVAHSQTSVVEWTATEYSFTAPDTLPAGLVTIRLTNLGHEVHHGQLLRLNEGVTFEEFTAALTSDGEAALRFTTLAGGPGAIDPQAASEVTLDLTPGAYVLACFVTDASGVPHVARGMLKPLEIIPADGTAMVAPSASDTFAMQDFSFEIPPTLPAGLATYQVVNRGPQPHEFDILKLAPGQTADDVLVWDSSPSGPPPFTSVGGLNGISAGASGYMTLDLDPGAYVAVCHIPDSGSGVAHLHLGMIEPFSVDD